MVTTICQEVLHNVVRFRGIDSDSLVEIAFCSNMYIIPHMLCMLSTNYSYTTYIYIIIILYNYIYII